MPITYWCMMLAAFSLMGVPLLFSGFWSNDMIIEAPLIAGEYWLFILAAITVAVTCFYTVRMLGMTFFGEKSRHIKEREHEGHHVHEASKVMWVPFALLVAGTILFGILNIATLFGFSGFMTKIWFETTFYEFLGGAISIGANAGVEQGAHAVAEHGISSETAVLMTAGISLIMLLVGALPAYYIYIKRKVDATILIERSGVLRNLRSFLLNRWYINRFFYTVLIYPMIRGSLWTLKKLELGGIDRFNYLLAEGSRGLCSRFRKSHTGILNYNIIGIVLGFVLIVILVALIAVG